MSANVVQFDEAAQLHNRCNLMDVVRRYITFCNALTGHFTRMQEKPNLGRNEQVSQGVKCNTL